MIKSKLTTSAPGIYTSVDDLLSTRSYAKDFVLETHKLSRANIDGSSKSTRRGRGMEFAEVRHYQPGDDVRNIDWRVTARTNETFTKLFQEEKERAVYIVVDQRPSMFFGSQLQFKSVLAAKIAAFVAWCAYTNNDKIGALIFGDHSQDDHRAKRGKHAVLRFIHGLVSFNQKLESPFTGEYKPSDEQNKDISQNTKNTLTNILNETLRVARPGSLIFVISDFHDFSEECRRTLSLISRHNEIELLHLFDPIESTLPKGARLKVSDGHTRLTIDSNDKALLNNYQSAWQDFLSQLNKKAGSVKANINSLSTAQEYGKHIQKVFKSKKHRGKKS